MQEGSQGEEGVGRAELSFFYFLSLEGWLYTHLARKVEGLYIIFFFFFFLDTVHSTPPPIHGPSFSHSVAFSLDRHHVHAHTINYTLYSLSISLSFTHTLSIALSRSLSRLFTPRYSSDTLAFFFFAPF